MKGDALLLQNPHDIGLFLFLDMALSLGFCIVAILPPFGGVGVNIAPNAEIVRLIADDAVVIAALPDFFSGGFADRVLKERTSFPRDAVGTDGNDHVYVVGHDNIGVAPRYAPDIPFRKFPVF